MCCSSADTPATCVVHQLINPLHMLNRQNEHAYCTEQSAKYTYVLHALVFRHSAPLLLNEESTNQQHILYSHRLHTEQSADTPATWACVCTYCTDQLADVSASRVVQPSAHVLQQTSIILGNMHRVK